MKMICDQFNMMRNKGKEDVMSFPWVEPPPLPPPPPRPPHHDLPPLPPGLSQSPPPPPQSPLLQTGLSLKQQVPPPHFLPLHLAPPPPPFISPSMAMANTTASGSTECNTNQHHIIQQCTLQCYYCSKRKKLMCICIHVHRPPHHKKGEPSYIRR